MADDARDKRHSPAGAFAPHGIADSADAQLFSVHDWPQQHAGAGAGFLPHSLGYAPYHPQSDPRHAAFPDAAPPRPGEHELFPQQFAQYPPTYPPQYPAQLHSQHPYHHHSPPPLGSQSSSGPDAHHSSFMPSAMGSQAHYLPQDYYPPAAYPSGEVGGYHEGHWASAGSASAGAHAEYQQCVMLCLLTPPWSRPADSRLPRPAVHTTLSALLSRSRHSSPARPTSRRRTSPGALRSSTGSRRCPRRLTSCSTSKSRQPPCPRRLSRLLSIRRRPRRQPSPTTPPHRRPPA